MNIKFYEFCKRLYGLFKPILLKQTFLKRLISILAVGVLSWHVVGIGLWNNYLASFKMMLDSKQGLLVWEQAKKQLSSAEDRKNLSLFQWAWTAPTMSYLLSKEGKVGTIITNPSIPVWQPFDPTKWHNLPRNEFFVPSRYIQALNAESGIMFFDLLTDSMPPCIKSIEGMSYNEGWAKWTNSKSVHINFIRTLPKSFDLILDIAFVFEPNINQSFKVIVGNSIQEFKPVNGKPSLVRLPFENQVSSDRITLIVPKPTSPKEYLGTSDERLLGIALKSFSIALADCFVPSRDIQGLNAESGIIFFDLLTNSTPPCIKSIKGMSRNEGWAKWTNSDSVHINFIRTLPESFDLILDIAAVFGPNINQSFKVIVGNSTQEFKPVNGKPSLVRLHFENQVFSDRITLIVPEPASPKKYLGTGDKRLLGIALKSFRIALTD